MNDDERRFWGFRPWTAGGMTIAEAQKAIENLPGNPLGPVDKQGRPLSNATDQAPAQGQVQANPGDLGPTAGRPRYAPTTIIPPFDPDQFTEEELMNIREELEEQHRQLGYNEKGASQGAMIWQNPLDSFEAYRTASEAREGAEARYPNSLHNGEGDAFRHAYWSYLLSKKIGATAAKEITDAHERSESDLTRPGEIVMDLYNNRFGRGLTESKNKEDAVKIIQDAIRDGTIRVKPYRFNRVEGRN